MKYKFIQTLLLVLFPTLFVVCGSDNNDPANSTGGLSADTDLKNNRVSAKGGSFLLQIRTDGKQTVSSQGSWRTINNKEGNGDAPTIYPVSANSDDKHYTVTTVTPNEKSENVAITRKGGDGEEPDLNPNPLGYAGRTGILKLKGGNSNLFITRTAQYSGKEVITYSFEYDCTQKNSRWIAFIFNTSMSDNSVGRAGGLSDDSSIPS